MTIRNKITLTFTLLTGTLLLFFFVIIYVLTKGYTKQEFSSRLLERAMIIGQRELEKDEVSTAIYNQIIEKHWQKLPMEQEFVLQVDTSKKIILDEHSPKLRQGFVSEVLSKGYAQYEYDDTLSIGMLYIDNQGNYLVFVSAFDQYGHSKMDYLRNVVMGSFIVGLLSIYFIGRLYAGSVLSPISDITDRANTITASNLHLRLEIYGSKDELASLSKTINGMLDRLEVAFDAQTHFVNNASHELRNPLAAILGETEIALNRERPIAEYQQALQQIEIAAKRLDELVSSLLKLAQAEYDMAVEMTLVRVDELVIEAQASLLKKDSRRVVFDFSHLPNDSDSLLVMGNKSLLKLAINNVVDNAVKFSVEEVAVRLSTAGNNIELVVTDKGIGIPEIDLKNITGPFYRASNAMGQKGVGIGLSLSQNIITLHRGSLRFTSQLEKGTIATILLPKAIF